MLVRDVIKLYKVKNDKRYFKKLDYNYMIKIVV